MCWNSSWIFLHDYFRCSSRDLPTHSSRDFSPRVSTGFTPGIFTEAPSRISSRVFHEFAAEVPPRISSKAPLILFFQETSVSSRNSTGNSPGIFFKGSPKVSHESSLPISFLDLSWYFQYVFKSSLRIPAGVNTVILQIFSRLLSERFPRLLS